MRSSSLSRTNSLRASSGCFSPLSATPRAWVKVEATSPGSVKVASATKNTPSSNSSTSSAADCSATRVFPVPPVPVRVSKRTSARLSRSETSDTSRSRPTSGVGWVGRLFRRASRVSSGGKEEGRSGAMSSKTCSGPKRSFKRLSPKSLSSAPSGNWSRTNSWVESEINICPPCPAERSLATRFKVGPK